MVLPAPAAGSGTPTNRQTLVVAKLPTELPRHPGHAMAMLTTAGIEHELIVDLLQRAERSALASDSPRIADRTLWHGCGTPAREETPRAGIE
jgi:hypothetical protein